MQEVLVVNSWSHWRLVRVVLDDTGGKLLSEGSVRLSPDLRLSLLNRTLSFQLRSTNSQGYRYPAQRVDPKRARNGGVSHITLGEGMAH